MKEGNYLAKVKCNNLIEAMISGVGCVYPEAKMKFDGKWCMFYKKKKLVFDCNPTFAKHNFELIKL